MSSPASISVLGTFCTLKIVVSATVIHFCAAAELAAAEHGEVAKKPEAAARE